MPPRNTALRGESSEGRPPKYEREAPPCKSGGASLAAMKSRFDSAWKRYSVSSAHPPHSGVESQGHTDVVDKAEVRVLWIHGIEGRGELEVVSALETNDDGPFVPMPRRYEVETHAPDRHELEPLVPSIGSTRRAEAGGRTVPQ